MNRPIVKYVVRVALFASATLAVACSNSTAPAPVAAKQPALRDSTSCPFGWTVGQGNICTPTT